MSRCFFNMPRHREGGRVYLHSMLWVVLAIVMCTMSCERSPKLLLWDESGKDRPMVMIDMNVMWQYHIDFNWQSMWTFAYDDEDMLVWGYTEPSVFELRRYPLGREPGGRHTTVDGYYIRGHVFDATFNVGYYDILTWNSIAAPDGVQSIWLDEETTLDSVMAYTNAAQRMARYEGPGYGRAHHQPEELFAAYKRNLNISANPEDYEHYDPETETYTMRTDVELHPVTYIYLTQVRLHNNKGRIDNVDGTATLSGMARGVCLNSGIATPDAICVNYDVHMRRNRKIRETGEIVDVVGGRCLTFGIPNQNSARVSRAEGVKDERRHYLDVNMVFNNGMDSTLVFDVTDSIRKYYRGGVITIDLNVDDISIPTRSGGSAFNPVVKEYEEVTHEFEVY